MNPASPAPDVFKTAELLLRTGGACDIGPSHLLDVFGRQRQRFIAILRGFGPDDWAAPTRCAAWSAHDVVRHLCDANAVAAADADDRTLDLEGGFDPRVTPRTWPAISADQPPDVTLGRFVATTGDLLGLARDRLARGQRFDVCLPYGPMDWTMVLLHAFWDSWLHERDIVLARGNEHRTDGNATCYATAYGLFIAAAVAAKFGWLGRATLSLSGAGGGVFDVDSDGIVTLAVTRGRRAGPAAARVADALAGRAPTAVVLGDLSASARIALSGVADFFNTP
jgi:uncharacterized protein (TIGR03083 family)